MGITSTQSIEDVRISFSWTKVSCEVIQIKVMSSTKNEKVQDKQGAWQECRAQLTVKREAKEPLCSEEIHTLTSKSSRLPVKQAKEENQP